MAKKAAITENGITIRLNQDMTATVLQYTGGQIGAAAIVIPNSVQGHTVTGIEPYVFSSCGNISVICIPPTVTYIGIRALPRCRTEQEKVCIGEEIIGYDYFQGCIKQEYWGPVYEYVTKEIPIVQVTRGSYAERYCKENNILCTVK